MRDTQSSVLTEFSPRLQRPLDFLVVADHAENLGLVPMIAEANPEDLWRWMEAYEEKTGGRLLALAHNGNLSNGLMFDDVTRSDRPLDRRYAERRML